jgi:hypothetical protein
MTKKIPLTTPIFSGKVKVFNLYVYPVKSGGEFKMSNKTVSISFDSMLVKKIGIVAGVAIASLLAGGMISGGLKASAISSGEQHLNQVRVQSEQQVSELQKDFDTRKFNKINKLIEKDLSQRLDEQAQNFAVRTSTPNAKSDFIAFAATVSPQERIDVVKYYCERKPTFRGLMMPDWQLFSFEPGVQRSFQSASGYFENSKIHPGLWLAVVLSVTAENQNLCNLVNI